MYDNVLYTTIGVVCGCEKNIVGDLEGYGMTVGCLGLEGLEHDSGYNVDY